MAISPTIVSERHPRVRGSRPVSIREYQLRDAFEEPASMACSESYRGAGVVEAAKAADRELDRIRQQIEIVVDAARHGIGPFEARQIEAELDRILGVPR